MCILALLPEANAVPFQSLSNTEVAILWLIACCSKIHGQCKISGCSAHLKITEDLPSTYFLARVLLSGTKLSP